MRRIFIQRNSYPYICYQFVIIFLLALFLTPVALSNGNNSLFIASDSTHIEDSSAIFSASSLSSAGSVLSSGNKMSQASHIATSAAGSELENWLRQFGTAQVQLNVNDKFNLDNSSLDLLLPLYDTNKYLFFSQWGLRYKDNRTTWNIGLGARTFQGNWLLGINSFYDYDMTGENKRWGIGGEAWTDYLKLSANGYFGITNWHQSRDFTDYNERPANGFDVRADAYLPAYPQLGAKLMYEKYKGDNVALFGTNNLQHAPSAVTLGVNYTPIPLLTVGVDHKQGQGNKHDSRLQLVMNFQLGVPWSAQIDPGTVSNMRTLSGSRYDLVDRNNNIVLEYKKHGLITLSLPEQVTGKAGERAQLTAKVTSTYGLNRIEWDTAALLANGGSIDEASKTTLTITFPPYQAGTEALNTYNISAIAYDQQGNKSNIASTIVRVQPPETTKVTLDLTITQDNAVANGIATNSVQAKVSDSNGNPLSNYKVTFTATNGAVVTPVIDVTDANGLTTVMLTNINAGITQVTAALDNGEQQSVNTTFVSAVPAKISIVTTKDNAIKDGIDQDEVEATVIDANGTPLKGVTVNFGSDNSFIQVLTPVVTTDANGKAVTAVVSKSSRSGVVTAKLDNGLKDSTTVNFSLLTKKSVIVKNNAQANGIDNNIYSITLIHDNGQPAPGQIVTFSTDDPMILSALSAVTDESGTATVSMTSTIPSRIGGYSLLVQANGCCTITQGGINFK